MDGGEFASRPSESCARTDQRYDAVCSRVTGSVSSWDICHAVHEEVSGASEGLFSIDVFPWRQKVDRYAAFLIKESRIVWILVKVC
jgi:hypothetical protein